MRTKTAYSIEQSVQQTLAETLDVAGPRLSLVGDAAYLEGTVPSYQHKTMAADTVRLLTGASRVVNRLRVVPSRSKRDRDLREVLLKSLPSHLKGAADGLSVLVRHGVVELKGTVASLADRCAAESVAWSVGGVVDVYNHLRIRGGASSPASLVHELRQAVVQCLCLDTGTLDVTVQGHTVLLRGQVPSPYHRQAAEELVRAHSQVQEVINELLPEDEPETSPPAPIRASA